MIDGCSRFGVFTAYRAGAQTGDRQRCLASDQRSHLE